MTQIIQLFLQYDSKELKPFLFFQKDSENWTFFFEYDSKNWTFFWIWLEELNLFFWIWLEELNSSSYLTQRNRTLFFFEKKTQKYDSKNWTPFLNTTQKNWIFFHMILRIEPFFFSNMTLRIELFFFTTKKTKRIENFFQKERLKECFFEHNSKNWTLLKKDDSKNRTLFSYNSKIWFFHCLKELNAFWIWLNGLNLFSTWLKELDLFYMT